MFALCDIFERSVIKRDLYEFQNILTLNIPPKIHKLKVNSAFELAALYPF